MPEGIRSACVNHPGVEAVIRCKQCGKPVCSACMVSGPSGRFCSDGCQQRHFAFMKRAQELETKKRAPGGLAMLRKIVAAVLVIGAAVGAALFVGYLFDVPVLKDFALKAMQLTGIGN